MPLRAALVRAFWVCTLPLLFLTACDSADPVEADPLGVTGRWEGNLTFRNPSDTSDVQTFPVQMTLRDVVSTITGSGTVTLPTETLAFNVVTGLYDSRFRTVSLTLYFDRPPQGALSGIVSVARDEIVGTMSGPGLVNGRVEFTLNVTRKG